jgi:hypothetical protein
MSAMIALVDKSIVDLRFRDKKVAAEDPNLSSAQ